MRIDTALAGSRGQQGMAASVQEQRAVPGGDVAPQSDTHALVQRCPQWEHSVREVEVREWAMSYGRSLLLDQCQVFIADKIRMCQDGVLAQQPKPGQNFCVARAKALLNEVTLPIAFRAMGLDQTV